MACSCEYGDEPSGSIKCGEFLEKLSRGFNSLCGVRYFVDSISPAALCPSS